MTVNELENRLGAKELTEWMIYANLEPFGSDIDALRFGSVASIIANVNRDTKKRATAYQPYDFAIAGKNMKDSITKDKSEKAFNTLMNMANRK